MPLHVFPYVIFICLARWQKSEKKKERKKEKKKREKNERKTEDEN